MKRTVLFLCAGNSCRSQMAEAIITHERGAHWMAYSAGVQPAGFVHPYALRVLQEIGIDHSHARSKAVDELREIRFDLVVTVCDDAVENCPVWLGSGRRAHVGFPDPANARGTEAEMLAQFRAVRDDIRRRVIALLDEFMRKEL